MLGQSGITPVSGTATNGLGAQAVGQAAGTDDFYPIGEYHQTDRRTGEVVSVNQCIDQQFFQRLFRNFQLS